MALSDLVKATKNEFAGIVSGGVPAADLSGCIDTGSYMLNALLSGSIFGGFQDNKFTMVAGEQGTGKTFLALSAVKYFLDNDPEAMVVYFDTEAAVSQQTCIERGIDPDRIAIINVTTVQEFRHQAVLILNKYIETKKEDRKPLLMVVDSIGMLSTTKEVEDITEGKETRDMTRAQLLKGTFRVLTLLLAKAHVAIIGTNHTYSTMGFISQQVASGGSGPMYSASSIIYLSKAREKGEGGVQSGTKPLCTLSKGRFTKEGSKVRCLIDFKIGLDRHYGMLDVATAAGIFKKDGHKYVIDEKGTKAWSKEINAEPEKYYTEEILQKVDDYVAQQFKYGSAIDEAVEGDTAAEQQENEDE